MWSSEISIDEMSASEVLAGGSLYVSEEVSVLIGVDWFSTFSVVGVFLELVECNRTGQLLVLCSVVLHVLHQCSSEDM